MNRRSIKLNGGRRLMLTEGGTFPTYVYQANPLRRFDKEKADREYKAAWAFIDSGNRMEDFRKYYRKNLRNI